jgi:hypothetical protein
VVQVPYLLLVCPLTRVLIPRELTAGEGSSSPTTLSQIVSELGVVSNNVPLTGK